MRQTVYGGNADYKRAFVAYYNKHPYTRSKQEQSEVGLTMKWLAPHEDRWGCDLCLQTDIAELQGLVDLASSGSRIYILLITREYIKWCAAAHIPDACTKLLELSTSKFEKIRLSTVSSPTQLQYHLNAIYRPEFERTIDNTYRSFFWLAFSGLVEKEAYEIETDDVDIDAMCVNYRGRKLPLYKEGIPALQSCKEDASFVYSHDTYITRDVNRPRIHGKNLLRGILAVPDMENKLMRIKVHIKQAEAYKDGRIRRTISYAKIWKSGIFYREYNSEKEGSPTSFRDVGEIILDGGRRAYKESDVASAKEKYDRIVRDLTREYRQWKIAHNL